MKIAKGLVLIPLLCASAAFGSNITSVTAGGGGTYTIIETNPDVKGGNDMAGMTVSATFFGESALTCTWSNATGSCVNAGNFSIGFPINTSTDPDVSGNAGKWTVTNLRTGGTNALVSLTINGLAVGVGGIGIAFDRCLTSAGFDDLNYGGGVCNATSGGKTPLVGTTGSAFGWSAGVATGGTAGITADALYTNVLKIAAQAVQNDSWGSLTLTFGGTTFAGSNGTKNTFTFRADTDHVQILAPEPATLGLMGFALAGLGVLRFRRRS